MSGAVLIYFVPSMRYHAFIGHISNMHEPISVKLGTCFSDMSGSISFKLGMLIVHVGLLMQVLFFSRLDSNWPTGGHFVFCFRTFGVFFLT